MSSRSLRRIALGVAAVTSAAVTSVGAAAPATTAAPALRPIGHLSEADALWMPKRTLGTPLTATTTAAATGVRMPALTSASYKFSSILDGQPVRWNPCQAIHWRSNTARGPVGGLTVLKEAVVHMAALTGTTWIYDGASTATPSTSYLPTTPSTQNKPVLIGWTDGTASDLLRGKPAQVLGMTRTVWFGVDTGTQKVAATRGAVIALDRTDRLPLRGTMSWSATTLHELGHVMGLDHPSDSHQLMAATLPAVTDLQSGDRTGLLRLGRSAGCVTIPGV